MDLVSVGMFTGVVTCRSSGGSTRAIQGTNAPERPGVEGGTGGGTDVGNVFDMPVL
jgi:hypothetical protein